MSSVPRLVVLTDRRQSAAAGRDLAATVRAAVAAGAPAVLLREKDLPSDERAELGARVAEVVADHDARLLVASDRALATHLGAAGIHLAAADPSPDDVRTGDGAGSSSVDLLVGRSCHDVDELAAAGAVDYVTVSPVAPTASKPGYGPVLGPDGLARLAAATTAPVLALGGITPDLVPDCLAAGAHGVAVMGAVMRASDPATVVTDLLRHLTTRTPR